MDGFQAVTAVTISGAGVVGMVLALLGSIKLTLARQLKAGEGRMGGLLAAFNLALIPMMLLTGYLIDTLGISVVLIVGSLITSAAIFTLSLALTYRRAFVAVLFIGLGLAAVSTATVVLMPLAFFPRDTTPAEARALNLGHVFIALGALATPVLTDILLRTTLAYRRTVMLLAFVSLIPGFLTFIPAFGYELDRQTVSQFKLTEGSLGALRAARVPETVLDKLAPLVDSGKENGWDREQFLDELSRRLDQSERDRYEPLVLKKAVHLGQESEKLWNNPMAWHLLLAGLVFLFYAPLEGAVGVWSTTLLTEAGCSERRAAVILSCFWGSFLASRLLIAFLPLSAGWDPWLIAIPSLLAAVVLGNLSGSVGPASRRNGLLLLGFLLGPIFPTLVGVLFREFDRDRGTVYGVMFAIGSMGSLVLAPLIGLRVRKNSAHVAMRSTMLLALLLTIMAMVFALVVFPAISGR